MPEEPESAWFYLILQYQISIRMKQLSVKCLAASMARWQAADQLAVSLLRRLVWLLHPKASFERGLYSPVGRKKTASLICFPPKKSFGKREQIGAS